MLIVPSQGYFLLGPSEGAGSAASLPGRAGRQTPGVPEKSLLLLLPAAAGGKLEK
jgi:hypothetical protein